MNSFVRWALGSLLLIGTPCAAQVYDWSMQTAGTGPNFGYNHPFWGPRNYIAAGNFNASNFPGNNTSFQFCDETNTATWSPSSTSFSGNNVQPSYLFDRHFYWPYLFRWHCSFDDSFFFSHPANFYAGVVSANLHWTTSAGVERYNYILFELKAPLQAGVAYVFTGSIAAGTITPTAASPHLDNIGLALLHDLPVPDTSYAFLDGITPWLSTPSGVVTGPNTTTLTDTIIGNGERYLVVGLFDPIADHTVSHPPALNTAYTYVLDNFFLYRRDCPYANTQFAEPSDVSCRDEPYELQLMYTEVSPARQWFIDDVFQVDSTDIRITIPHGGTPQTTVTAVTGTDACVDTARFTVDWRYVEPLLPDTFTVCGQTVELLVDTTLHNVLPLQLYVDWTNADGDLFLYDQHSLSAELPGVGTYFIRMDYNGCVQADTMVVGPDIPLVDTTLAGDPILLTEISPEHCVNMYDGSVIMHDTGYPGVLRFDWYDGPWAGVDTNRVDGLNSGTYHVRIADELNRCTEYEYSVPQLLTLCAMIRGTIYEDASFDCVLDSSEARHALRTVRAMPVGNVATTAPDGTYELLVPPGAHTVAATYPDPLVGNVCGNGTVVTLPSPGDVAEAVDIADTTHIPVHDMEVLYIGSSPWVIGFDGPVSIYVRNKGELEEQTILKVRLDHPDLVLATEAFGGTFLNMDGDTLFFQLPALEPGEWHTVELSCNIPPDPELLTTVAHIEAFLMPVAGETELVDNIAAHERPIVGAYDPNDKLVNPYGDPVTHAVDTTVHRLQYTIRFQNTGNWPATTVRLEDVLPPLLVPQSLRVIASSHAMHAYSFGGVLYFEFPSIMLPDSASDPEGSIGWVLFNLDVANGVVYGDSIINIAGIYFDQNPPIITPPAITRFAAPDVAAVLTRASAPAAQRFVLAPNPTNGATHIVDRMDKDPLLRVELIDVHGRITTMRSPQAGLELDDLEIGTYQVRILTRGGMETLRLVKY